MSEPQRWKVEKLNCCFDADMVESSNGEYVLYSDYKQLMTEVERLHAEFKRSIANLDWKPISTYKGGNWVYLFVPLDNIPGNYTIVEGCYMVGLQKWWIRSWKDTDRDSQIKPTHWMPLFVPPEVGD